MELFCLFFRPLSFSFGKCDFYTPDRSHLSITYSVCSTFCCTNCLTEVQPNDSILYHSSVSLVFLLCGTKTLQRILWLFSVEKCFGRSVIRCKYFYRIFFLIYYILKCCNRIKDECQGHMIFTLMHSQCCLCVCHLLYNLTFRALKTYIIHLLTAGQEPLILWLDR